MQTDIKNRGGRPPKDAPPLIAQEAQVVMLPDVVPPHICPKCGRGQSPRILAKRDNGERACACGLCGGRYSYTPPIIRCR